MKARTSIMLVLVAALLGMGIVMWHGRSVSAKSEALSCVNSLQEQCPSEDFLRSYNHWVVLRNKLGMSDGSESVVTREQLSDEFNGLTSRLQQSVPQGSTFDEVKRRFTLKSTAAGPVNPPGPPAISAPAKK